MKTTFVVAWELTLDVNEVTGELDRMEEKNMT